MIMMGRSKVVEGIMIFTASEHVLWQDGQGSTFLQSHLKRKLEIKNMDSSKNVGTSSKDSYAN